MLQRKKILLTRFEEHITLKFTYSHTNSLLLLDSWIHCQWLWRNSVMFTLILLAVLSSFKKENARQLSPAINMYYAG
jgi:hypothetical protein